MSERDMQRLLDLVERHLGGQWIDSIEWLRSLPANSVDEIERRLLAGDYAGVVQEVEQAALKFAAETHGAYVQSGKAAAQWLDKQPALQDTLVRFDATDDRVIVAARRNEIEMAHGLAMETRQTVNQILVDGARSGANPRELARDIRTSIGLTPTQEQHVRNYRRALETGDYQNALSRELSSGHSDRTIRTAQLGDRRLTPQQIDQAVERYRLNYVTYRAETIARTESARSVHDGVAESMRQAVDRGDIDAAQLVQEWHAGPRTKYARSEHQAMDGKRVPFGHLFVLPSGVQMRWPGDPQAPVSETANCRCTFSTTIES